MRTNKEEKVKSKWFRKIIIIAIFIGIIAVIINLAPNYIRKDKTGSIEVIINQNNVTDSMKFDVYKDENTLMKLMEEILAKEGKNKIIRCRNI